MIYVPSGLIISTSFMLYANTTNLGEPRMVILYAHNLGPEGHPDTGYLCRSGMVRSSSYNQMVWISPPTGLRTSKPSSARYRHRLFHLHLCQSLQHAATFSPSSLASYLILLCSSFNVQLKNPYIRQLCSGNSFSTLYHSFDMNTSHTPPWLCRCWVIRNLTVSV